MCSFWMKWRLPWFGMGRCVVCLDLYVNSVQMGVSTLILVLIIATRNLLLRCRCIGKAKQSQNPPEMHSSLYRNFLHNYTMLESGKIDKLYLHSIIYNSMNKDRFFNELNIRQSVMFPNLIQESSRQVVEPDFLKDLDFVELEDTGFGIILMSQDYTKLFYQPLAQLELPIQKVVVRFHCNERINHKWLMRLQLANDGITLAINPEFAQKHKILTKNCKEKPSSLLFPPPKRAPYMLQQKLWIQINKLTQSLSVSLGDVVENEDNVVFRHMFCEAEELKEGWNNEVDLFFMPNYNNLSKQPSKPKKINILQLVRYFKVTIEINQAGNPDTQQKIDDFFSVKVLNIGRLFNPVLQKNPSLLKPSVASLQSMPQPIKILYNYLENLQLQNLPDYQQKREQSQWKKQYLQWRDFQHSLHHSLTTPFGYTIDGKPIGILNHLYYVKLKKRFSNLSFNSQVGGFVSKDDLMKHIYNERGGYIRLELLPHEGLSPGSMAVMEIWPPFHSSSIHNHGASYGLIKVLSGNIRVENYTELSFDALNQKKPYLISDYTKGQFTWLSQCSFGIHRLLNLHHQTCVTLQAYYRHQNSKQYFSVVGQSQNRGVYKEYYPQNDWKCYLELVNQKIDEKSHIKKEDIEFINKVIATYNLQFYNEINSSFDKLALILRDEYDYAVNFTYSLQPSKVFGRSTSSNLNKNVIVWMDYEPKNIDLIQYKYLKGERIEIIKKSPAEIPTEGFKQVLRLLKSSDRKLLFIYNVGVLREEEEPVSRNAIVASYFELVCIRLKFQDPICIAMCYQYELPSLQRALQERGLGKVKLVTSLKDTHSLIIKHFKEKE